MFLSHIDVSLSLSTPFPFSLKSVNIYFLKMCSELQLEWAAVECYPGHL